MSDNKNKPFESSGGRSMVHSTSTDAGTAPVAWNQPGSLGFRAADTTLDVLTLAAGIATKPADMAFSAIRLIRSAVAGRFSAQVRAEWVKWVEAGKIKPDYADTDQARMIFADTLQSLEDANFDDEQLELLRKLFLAAASETTTDRDNLLVREYIEVGRTLATGEIRVLAAYYRYVPEWVELAGQSGRGPYGIHESFGVLQRHTGLKHVALIERHERTLIEKGLVRRSQGGYAEVDQKHYRLTDFGFAFCDFLQGYERTKGP